MYFHLKNKERRIGPRPPDRLPRFRRTLGPGVTTTPTPDMVMSTGENVGRGESGPDALCRTTGRGLGLHTARSRVPRDGPSPSTGKDTVGLALEVRVHR